MRRCDLTGFKTPKGGVALRYHKTVNARAIWECKCICGNLFYGNANDLKIGRVQQCKSCWAKMGGDRNRTHGMRHSPEYTTWLNIRSRCNDTKNTHYDRYGGRGIKVCAEWQHSFESFFRDVGTRPGPKMQLDRINNDGNYEPGNVRWTTIHVQSRNRSNNVLYTLNGRTQCLTDWCAEYGMRTNPFFQRIYAGWDIERALTTPVRIMHRRT